MKTAAVLSTLALAASATQAALTTNNATYDFLTVTVYEAYGSVGEIVANKTDDELTKSYETLLAEVETELEVAQQKYPYYADRLQTFFDDAAAYDEQYASLPEEYEAYDLSMQSYLTYAAAPYCDVVFDAVETFLPTLKNKTLSEWHMAQRQAIEKSVLKDVSAEELAEEISQYAEGLFEIEAAVKSFDEIMEDLMDRAVEEFDISYPGDEDEDESKSEEESEETEETK